MMHIVFTNYSDYSGNSGLHIHPLANELVLLGNRVTVFVPKETGSAKGFLNNKLYTVRSFEDYLRLTHQGELIFVAWTPREVVRKKTIALAQEYNAPYIVHLEDNEERLTEDNLKQPYSHLEKRSYDELDSIIPLHLSHPHRYKDFLSQSLGVSCIIDTLEEFVPKAIPALTFWPSCEDDFFNIEESYSIEIRDNIGIPETGKVIFYPGSMHATNAEEVSHLYKAVELLNNQGIEVYLIRNGENYVSFKNDIDPSLSCYIELGTQPTSKNLDYISVADILVQPGIDNDFNKYRFPSKLPMFLASGRPVITSNSNIGKSLTDWENCLKFVNGDPEELAHKISLLIDNPSMAKQIGIEGRKFAKEHFSWKRSAEKLLDYYSKLLKVKA